jgi:DNA-binding GntR family transcriptional regulator
MRRMRQQHAAPDSQPASPDYPAGDATADRWAEEGNQPTSQGLASEYPRRPDVINADQVLTDRIAAVLAHHQAGWTLPRQSVLARRYHASTRQVAAAIDELAARHLIRVLPDGRACRTSPAEYTFDLTGEHGLVARVEPLHGELSCKSHSVAWHPVRADISAALRIARGEPACILQQLWTVDGEPAAATTSYLAEPAAEPFLATANGTQTDSLGAILPMPPARAATLPERGERLLVPHALSVEMQQPPPWAAKVLRLSAGGSAIAITVKYSEPADGNAAALTTAVLRADHFRVIIDSTVTSSAGATDGHQADRIDPPVAL